MPDEKFIDYFIEQCEEVKHRESEYWVTVNSSKDELIHIKSPLIKKIEWSKKNILCLIDHVNLYEKLFLHSFFIGNLNFFLKNVRKDLEIVWIFWGADGYRYTPWEKRWYLPLTWKYKKSAYKLNKNIIKNSFYALNTFRKRWLRSRSTRELIKRVNICATWIRYDYYLIRHVNPKMQWMYYAYYTTEQMGLENSVHYPLNFNRLWLGNSATDTNNHLDALQFLKDIQWDGDIIVPLSYGSPSYAETISTFGKELFGAKFLPISELLPLDQYHKLMNSCGIVWMNHIRQQAAGNTLAALYLGKAVIMNKENNLYKTLSDWGIYFIEEEAIVGGITKQNESLLARNRSIISEHFSKIKNFESLRNILNRHL